MKTYKHLTKEERCLIYFLWNKEKYSMNKIAKILNKNKSTISRELKRNHLLQGFIIHQLLIKNTLEENQIVICFLCWSTKTSQIFLFKNLILNLMV
ncbi:helix-turn-helix domain-containing protein [Malacoplasma iowae]|uniref:helix-turn-helix domain-containing protein n=1 Tax=Malacoplasma iowae TaxID=2116 RepID=UPI003873C49C|nr:helix-turn-helix domain-containing protein [Malacoplasma iowae]